MFEKRLTAFWVLLTLLALVIAGRLVQIQVVQAAHYEQLAERMLSRPPDYITAPRGTVFDRHGTPLLTDEPTTNICIHYAVLTERTEVRYRYLGRLAYHLRELGEFDPDTPRAEVVAQLDAELHQMWPRLAQLLHRPVDELLRNAADVCARVDRIRAVVQATSPEIRSIEEETQLLPVITDVDSASALPVRLALENRPWLRVLPGARRVAHDSRALAHVLGRLGAASPERIAADPLRRDDLRGLRAGDQCGITGVERLAETTLRGWRGKLVEGFDRRVLERIDPIAGHDVHLTLDADLQQAVYDLLARAVADSLHPSGAAAVVLDAHTREILAAVSYPAYSLATFEADYERLYQDTKDLPLTFRAIQAQYPPGSICKAITMVGGLTEGVISRHTTFTCTGYLLPDKPTRHRCWINTQYGGSHGPLDAVEAVRNSCNIYFFKTGEKLGSHRLCAWFDRFGLGRDAGTGLIEESAGVNPTEAWMLDPARYEPRGYRPADAWNFSIGQGEVTVTPLQAANVAATVATGTWQSVTLARDDTGQRLGPPAAPAETFDRSAVSVLREGMWQVVNHEHGTAPRAKLVPSDYELCGKTGSAQTVPRVLNRRYFFEWPDGSREEVVAISKEDALRQFAGDEQPTFVGHRYHELYPRLHEDERLPSHAWFIGWTQPKSTPRGAAPTGPVYAISVVVEFAGSGGRVAGPVAKQIAEHLLGIDPEQPE